MEERNQTATDGEEAYQSVERDQVDRKQKQTDQEKTVESIETSSGDKYRNPICFLVYDENSVNGRYEKIEMSHYG